MLAKLGLNAAGVVESLDALKQNLPSGYILGGHDSMAEGSEIPPSVSLLNLCHARAGLPASWPSGSGARSLA